MKVVSSPSLLYHMTELQEIEYNKWLSLNDEFKDNTQFQQFLQKLILNECPVVLSIRHLAQIVDVDLRVLRTMINHPSSFYYEYSIPKRSGGCRQIASPYPALLRVQRWINDNILSKIPVHESAKGFVKGLSIVDNASPHLGHATVLKTDIKDFFPSIGINRVRLIFKRLGYRKKIAFALASLCCLDGSLPQGAATSPTISNIILKRLDARMEGLASRFGLVYTRYADDLTFSGGDIPARIIKYITDIISDEGFYVNIGKTKILRSGSQQIITGVSVSSGVIKLPREAKREIRKNVHHVLKNGLIAHLNHIGNFDPIYVERLLGKLYFWKSIEPENKFVEEYIPKMKHMLG